MIRLSGPRCLAMSVVGILLGWWTNASSVAEMTRYRSLSHDALLTELASQKDGVLSTSIIGGLIVVLAIVLVVDVLTRFFRAMWQRIEPPESRDSAGGTPRAAA
jgi:hypothetical protein